MQDSAIDFFLARDLANLGKEQAPEDLWKILESLEHLLPVRNTCPDIPYVLVPPALAPPARWEELLSSYHFPPGLLKRLLDRSFMPFDTARFDQITGGNSWLELPTRRSFVPIDLDYGVVPYAEDVPSWANVSFTRLVMDLCHRRGLARRFKAETNSARVRQTTALCAGDDLSRQSPCVGSRPPRNPGASRGTRTLPDVVPRPE